MMDCSTCREILSAALDGETAADEHAAALGHCGACPACASFAAALERLPDAAAFSPTPAGPPPDLVPAVLAAAREPVHDDVLVWRLALAFVACAQLLAAAVHLGGVHLARDQAAWEAALAAGFAWAAWKPARATGLLPLASVLSVLLVVNGGVTAGAGVHHLLAPLGTAFLLLATREGGRAPAVSA
jgi:predicted anti-sigma-YlaC factor YlaD